MVENGYSQSGHRTLKLTVSQEWTDGIKDDWKFFGVGMVKNGWSQSGDGSLKLTVSQEWIDWFN